MTEPTVMPVVLPDSPAELLAAADAIAVKLGSAVWPAVTEDELLAGARLLERVRARQEGVAAQLFTEINDRCAYSRDGFTHPMTWLAKGLRLGRPEAKKRYRRAEKIARLTAPTGQSLQPQFPGTAEAVADGAIRGAHVDEISDVMRRLPWKLSGQVAEQAETDLAAMARELTPHELRKAGIALLAYLDPDGALSDEKDRRRQRALHLGPQDQQLMSKLTATLTPTLRAKFELILANWAAPGMNNPADEPNERLHGSSGDHDPDDRKLTDARRRDRRNTEQRNHDALEALCDYITSHRGLGPARKIPGQLIITATLAELKASCGSALTTTGTLVPISELIEVAAHFDPQLVVFQDHTREILYHGRAKRTATFALFARDRGDTNPDSDTPFIFNEMHHLPDWAKGGATDIDKLTATSGRNNRAVGDKPLQWETIYQHHGPHTGRVAWRLRCHNGQPGTSRINNAHHADDLARDTITRIRERTSHDPDTNTDANAKTNNRRDSTDPGPPLSPTENQLCTRLGYTTR